MATNLFKNSDFRSTYIDTSYNTTLFTNRIPTGWSTYNNGISNPLTSYHAYIDIDTFDFPVCVFNESNGSRNWKALYMKPNSFPVGVLSDKLPNGPTTFWLSFDVYVTGSGAKLFGGFDYQQEAKGNNAFHSGQFNVKAPDLEGCIGQWKRISVKVPFNWDMYTLGSFYIYGYGFSANAILYIKNVKLEISESPTEWTPHRGDNLTPEWLAAHSYTPPIIARDDLSLSRVNDGTNGVSVTGITAKYLVTSASSGVTTSTSGWTATPGATTTTNKYLWTYETITYSSGTSTNLTPHIISTHGATGSTGTGISSITTEFYKSTSKTTQSGGSWSTSFPTWTSGTYLWKRTKIIYSNPTSTVYTTAEVDTTWEIINELQIGGRNLLKKSDTIFLNNSDYPSSSNRTRYKIAVTSNEKFNAWLIAENYLTVPVSELSVVGNQFTFSVEVKTTNLTASGPIFYVYFRNGTTQTDIIRISIPHNKNGIWQRISGTLTITGTATGLVIGATSNGLTGFNGVEIEYRNFKLERGNVATEWTPAPEDFINDIADLQTQVDGKIETFSQTSDPSSSWTTDTLKSQHAGDLWYNPSTKLTKRWSGSAWVNLENAEAQSASALAQKKAQVFTAQPTIPYYKGDLWVTSLNGTGVIKTCQTSRTSGSYTASDWVEGLKYTDDSAVNNLEIGSVNLLRDTKRFGRTNVASTEMGYMRNMSTLTQEVDGFLARGQTSSNTGTVAEWVITGVQPGEEYTFSFFARGTGTVRVYFHGPSGYIQVAKITCPFASNASGGDGNCNIPITNEWKRYYVTYKLESTAGTSNTKYLLVRNDNAGDYYIYGCKLERGSKATDWTPSPLDEETTISSIISDTEIGGRNLILNSNVAAENTNYLTKEYITTENLVEGRKYSVTIWGSLAEGKSFFGLWFNGASTKQCELKDNGDGTYSGTWTSLGPIQDSYIRTVRIYAYPSSVTGTSRIDKIKLEYGEKCTDWTPAPEDKANQSVLDAWASNAIQSGVTEINGGYIKTQTISTNQLDVEDILRADGAIMGTIMARELNADKITSGTILGTRIDARNLTVSDGTRTTFSVSPDGEVLLRGDVESYGYVQGTTGWSIHSDGTAEFNNVTVRGDLITSSGGISKEEALGDIQKVRIWAGSSYEERESAPFIVYSDGSVKSVKGDFSGLWTGNIEVGNIKIQDPSAIAGEDALLEIKNGSTGVKRVKLTDMDASEFKQSIKVFDTFTNATLMSELGMDGNIYASNSIKVSSSAQLSSSDLEIGGAVLSGTDGQFICRNPLIVGQVGRASSMTVYGDAEVTNNVTLRHTIDFDGKVTLTIVDGGFNLDYAD